MKALMGAPYIETNESAYDFQRAVSDTTGVWDTRLNRSRGTVMLNVYIAGLWPSYSEYQREQILQHFVAYRLSR